MTHRVDLIVMEYAVSVMTTEALTTGLELYRADDERFGPDPESTIWRQGITAELARRKLLVMAGRWEEWAGGLDSAEAAAAVRECAADLRGELTQRDNARKPPASKHDQQ